MTKHTPGPWAVHSDRLSIHRPAMPEDEGHEIRRLVALVYSNCQAGDSNLDANARLIAAAPDMLDALHALLSALDQEILECLDDAIVASPPLEPAKLAALLNARDAASEAIAKTEGREE